jgi:U3 small nucleolar RNA-associated protein 15
MIWPFLFFLYRKGGRQRVIVFIYTLVRMDYQRVVVRKYPKTTQKQSPEGRYWRQFKNPVFIKDGAAVTSVHFTASKPHRYAVTSGARVQIYAPRTQKLVKTISRFKDVAHSGNIRADGKLLVAGDDSGVVQVSLPYISLL